MPNLLTIEGFRFFFYSLEDREAPHFSIAHCRYTKFWLDPVNLAANRGFRIHELTNIRILVDKNRKFFLESWNAYFSGK